MDTSFAILIRNSTLAQLQYILRKFYLSRVGHKKLSKNVIVACTKVSTCIQKGNIVCTNIIYAANIILRKDGWENMKDLKLQYIAFCDNIMYSVELLEQSTAWKHTPRSNVSENVKEIESESEW